MKIFDDKFWVQLSGGIFGGTILGLIGFVDMSEPGRIHDWLWSTVGTFFGCIYYGSCSILVAWLGVILGSILGISFLSMIKTKNYSKIIFCLILLSICGPIFYCIIRFFPDSFTNYDIFLVFIATGFFVLFSTLVSGAILGLLKVLKYFREK